MERDDEFREAWEDYRSRQEFEHNLIDRKISWFATMQGIMFAAYGFTFGEARSPEETIYFRCVLALLGLILSIITMLGVGAVVCSKWLSFQAYKAFCNRRNILPPEPHDTMQVQWGVKTLNTFVTLIPDVLTPALFIGGWVFLLVNIKINT